jgi:hypothetical protein
MNLKIDSDAFSAGQVESKIWAAEELEKVSAHINILRISMLGGWYGLFHFILKSRSRQMIEWCRSYDLDAGACSIANVVNNTWDKDWAFRAIPKDANELTFNDDTNCVVNTSTEHFDSKEWYDNIPEGTLCVFQGNDLIIEDHVNRPKDLDNFKSLWPLQTILFEGTKYFNFETNPYTRYMIIGHK